jgi:Cdc6-like AAA superfamily ATPase
MSQYTTNVDRLYDYDPFSMITGIPLEDIEDLYVPFDEMMNYSVIEKKMLDEFTRQSMPRFYGILGRSGSGKSSILNYLLAKMSRENSRTFCIKLNNFSDEIREPKDLLRNVIKKIHDMSSQFVSVPDEQKEHARKILSHSYSYAARKEKGSSLRLGGWFNIIPFIVGIRPEVGTKLKQQSEIVTHSESTSDEMLTYLDQIVDILKNEAKMDHVVVMFDETDKIREVDQTEPSVESAIKFFAKNLPVLEKTKCSFIFIMNEQYDSNSFKAKILDNYFAPVLKVPPIESKRSIEMIIQKRTKATCGDIGFGDVWDEGTTDLLYEYYREKSLRQMMSICRLSIQKARDGGSETISVSHVKNAIMELNSR